METSSSSLLTQTPTQASSSNSSSRASNSSTLLISSSSLASSTVVAQSTSSSSINLVSSDPHPDSYLDLTLEVERLTETVPTPKVLVSTSNTLAASSTDLVVLSLEMNNHLSALTQNYHSMLSLVQQQCLQLQTIFNDLEFQNTNKIDAVNECFFSYITKYWQIIYEEIKKVLIFYQNRIAQLTQQKFDGQSGLVFYNHNLSELYIQLCDLNTASKQWKVNVKNTAQTLKNAVGFSDAKDVSQSSTATTTSSSLKRKETQQSAKELTETEQQALLISLFLKEIVKKAAESSSHIVLDPTYIQNLQDALKLCISEIGFSILISKVKEKSHAPSINYHLVQPWVKELVEKKISIFTYSVFQTPQDLLYDLKKSWCGIHPDIPIENTSPSKKEKSSTSSDPLAGILNNYCQENAKKLKDLLISCNKLYQFCHLMRMSQTSNDFRFEDMREAMRNDMSTHMQSLGDLSSSTSFNSVLTRSTSTISSITSIGNEEKSNADTQKSSTSSSCSSSTSSASSSSSSTLGYLTSNTSSSTDKKSNSSAAVPSDFVDPEQNFSQALQMFKYKYTMVKLLLKLLSVDLSSIVIDEKFLNNLDNNESSDSLSGLLMDVTRYFSKLDPDFKKQQDKESQLKLTQEEKNHWEKFLEMIKDPNSKKSGIIPVALLFPSITMWLSSPVRLSQPCGEMSKALRFSIHQLYNGYFLSSLSSYSPKETDPEKQKEKMKTYKERHIKRVENSYTLSLCDIDEQKKLLIVYLSTALGSHGERYIEFKEIIINSLYADYLRMLRKYLDICKQLVHAQPSSSAQSQQQYLNTAENEFALIFSQTTLMNVIVLITDKRAHVSNPFNKTEGNQTFFKALQEDINKAWEEIIKEYPQKLICIDIKRILTTIEEFYTSSAQISKLCLKESSPSISLKSLINEEKKLFLNLSLQYLSQHQNTLILDVSNLSIEEMGLLSLQNLNAQNLHLKLSSQEWQWKWIDQTIVEQWTKLFLQVIEQAQDEQDPLLNIYVGMRCFPPLQNRPVEDHPLVHACFADNVNPRIIQFLMVHTDMQQNVVVTDSEGQYSMNLQKYFLRERSLGRINVSIMRCLVPTYNLNLTDAISIGDLDSVISSLSLPRDSLPGQALSTAIQYQYIQIVILLVERFGRQNPDLLLQQDDLGQTSFFIACRIGSLPLAVYLFHESNLNKPNNKNHSPLYMALRNNYLDVAQFLFSMGVSLAEDVESAILLDKATLVKQYLAKHPQPTINVVALAAEWNRSNILMPLLNNNICCTERQLKHSLLIACQKGHTGIVEILFVYQEKSVTRLIKRKSFKHECALFTVIKYGHDDILALLIRKKTNLQTYRSSNHETALHYAIRLGNYNVVDTLLKTLTIDDLNIQMVEGNTSYTAIALAARYVNQNQRGQEIFDLLQKTLTQQTQKEESSPSPIDFFKKLLRKSGSSADLSSSSVSSSTTAFSSTYLDLTELRKRVGSSSAKTTESSPSSSAHSPSLAFFKQQRHSSSLRESDDVDSFNNREALHDSSSTPSSPKQIKERTSNNREALNNSNSAPSSPTQRKGGTPPRVIPSRRYSHRSLSSSTVDLKQLGLLNNSRSSSSSSASSMTPTSPHTIPPNAFFHPSALHLSPTSSDDEH
jgi:ankyrin repeat protein